jgi:Uma2 family endonuclease
LFRRLDAYVEHQGAGQVLYAPFDVKLSLFTVLVPDLIYFSTERFARVVNQKHATAAPDLVVEVLSPGTRRRDKGRKRAIYEREGVSEYWIVDPDEKTVTVLRTSAQGSLFVVAGVLRAADDDAIESPLFPGLEIPLSQVFLGLGA